MGIMDQFSLRNRCSIVTGAAMGLGKAMAAALAEAGSDLVIADINMAEAEKTAAEFRTLGVRAMVVKTDVTNPQTVDDMVGKVMAEFGRIDVLINNAGITKHVKAEDLKLADWQRVLDVNLNGVFIVSQAVGRIMIQQQRGSIINISSMSGIIVNTPQAQSAYNVSKAGVIMLTKSLANEFVGRGVRVNAVAPGGIDTPIIDSFALPEGANRRMLARIMSPLGYGRAEDVAALIAFIASDEAAYMTGSIVSFDGGITA